MADTNKNPRLSISTLEGRHHDEIRNSIEIEVAPNNKTVIEIEIVAHSDYLDLTNKIMSAIKREVTKFNAPNITPFKLK